MLATLVAGGLGIGGHHLATLFGERGEPILILTFVFIMGTKYMHFVYKKTLKQIVFNDKNSILNL